MCWYFCTGFIDFMLKGKSLFEYTNSFSPNDYGKNDKNNAKNFSVTKKIKKLYCVICGKYRKIEKPKILYLLEILVLSIICSKCKKEDEKYLNKKIKLRY